MQPEELGAALRPLSRAQAEAVKRRVKSLNHTVKQRFNQRQRVRKPDIRDVFKDMEVRTVIIAIGNGRNEGQIISCERIYRHPAPGPDRAALHQIPWIPHRLPRQRALRLLHRQRLPRRTRIPRSKELTLRLA